MENCNDTVIPEPGDSLKSLKAFITEAREKCREETRRLLDKERQNDSDCGRPSPR